MKKPNWLLRHTLTVFSCVLITVLGIAFLTHADPVTTTIGDNIATNDLSVSGNVTSGTWQGTLIGTQYGGTGQDFSGSTGIIKLTGGTASMVTDGSANWDTAYTYSQVGHLSLAGGQLTGNLTFSGNQTVDGIDVSAIPSTYLPLAGGTLIGSLTVDGVTGLVEGDIPNLSAGKITSGTLTHERGGLETDVSAYNGILKISGGTASVITDNSANWNTAYGWGDWSGQGFITAYSTNALTNKSGNISMWVNDSGYLTGNETITLSGDITGSGATAISTTLGNGIDTTKLADGSVSDTEFQYLNGVTSALQTQLNGKITIPGSSAQGDILFRNASEWTGLGYGTSGQFLKTQGESADPVWAVVSTTYARTATKVVCASGTTIDITNCDYLCSGDSDQSEINTAITSIASTGGSVVLMEGTYTITTPILMNTDNVSLIGQGKGTKIQLATAVQSNIIESTGGHSRLLIANLYLDGTTSAEDAGDDTDQCGIYFNNVDDSKIKDIWSLNNKQVGINLYTGSERNEITGCECNDNPVIEIFLYSASFNKVSNNICKNSGDQGGICLSDADNNLISGNLCQGNSMGVYLYGSNSQYNKINENLMYGNEVGIILEDGTYNTVNGNICQNNTEAGIHLNFERTVVSGNLCQGNGNEGIYLDCNSDYSLVVGNMCVGNNHHGIKVGNTKHNNIIGNHIYDNGKGVASTYDGIYIRAGLSDYNNIQNNIIRKGTGNTHRYGIRIDESICNDNLIVNNDIYDAGGTANFSDVGTNTIVRDNRGTEITDDKVLVRAKNTSTVELVLGDIVILKSVVAGNEITTTTVAGDDKVFGMVVETIANDASGLVQTLGKTVSLKVDGTTDIAVGDFLGTFTTAKIGMKAGTGDMAFAIALEAYATDNSNGVIDALLITPRKL